MLNACGDPMVGSNVWMLPAQAGKTQAAIAVVGYFAEHDPSSILYKFPTQEASESFSKEKLASVIDESPTLRDTFIVAKSREGSNTIMHKKFRGGFVALVGANSPTDLRRRSCRVVIQDEVDADPASASVEGSPHMLADARAKTFSNAILLKMSTPTIKGESVIERHYEDTDRCKWYVPCPHCNAFQVLTWEGIKFEKGKEHQAAYMCEACKKPWTDSERIQSVHLGEWRASSPFRGRRGYWLNGFNRVIGVKRDSASYLHEFVKEYQEACLNDQSLVVWTNTVKCETYEQRVEAKDWNDLYQRRETYTIPKEVLVLIASVDVQANRLEAEVVGFGLGEECWHVAYHVLPGDPNQPQVWEKLDIFLGRFWKRDDGQVMKIHCTAIDTGHATKVVYAYCQGKMRSGVYAIKGRGGPGLPLVAMPRRSGVTQVFLFQVGTDTAKGLIYSRLGQVEPGPGYHHFPIKDCYSEAYFKALTSEVVIIKTVSGKKVRTFEQRGSNEALDLACYQVAALTIAQPNLKRLARRAPAAPADPKATLPSIPEPTAPQPKPVKLEPILVKTDPIPAKTPRVRIVATGIGKGWV